MNINSPSSLLDEYKLPDSMLAHQSHLPPPPHFVPSLPILVLPVPPIPAFPFQNRSIYIYIIYKKNIENKRQAQLLQHFKKKKEYIQQQSSS